MIELKIEKMYDDVIMPEYMQLGDAGFDIHCYLHDESGEPVKSIKIWPNSSAKIHTGLKTSFPHGYSLELVPRGSMGIKKNLMLMNTIGIVDSQFDQEILLFVYNYGNEPVEILHQERLVQGMIKKCEEVKIVQVDKIDKTSRGDGFGSSGRV